jgi:hypothetical protein
MLTNQIVSIANGTITFESNGITLIPNFMKNEQIQKLKVGHMHKSTGSFSFHKNKALVTHVQNLMWTNMIIRNMKRLLHVIHDCSQARGIQSRALVLERHSIALALVLKTLM